MYSSATGRRISFGSRERSANLVDTEGRQPRDDGSEGLSDANVVRFPRDWFGPREELIPFGSSAETPNGDDAGPAGLPPTADDFWGESSSSIQNALRAPAPDPDAAGPSALEEENAGRPARPPRTLLPHGPRRGRPVRRPSLLWVWRAGAPEGMRGRGRLISILGVAAVALAIGLVLAATGSDKPGTGGLVAVRAGRSSAGSSSANSQRTRRGGIPALERAGRLRAATAVRASRRPASRGRSASRQSSASRQRSARQQRSSSRYVRSAPRLEQQAAHQVLHTDVSPGNVQRVHYTSSPAPSGGGSSATSSAPSGGGSSPTSPSPAPPSPGPTATASGGSGQTPSSGNQPVLGANGALAPGSSPDG